MLEYPVLPRGFCRLLATALFCLPFPAGADEEPDWIPSLALGVVAQVQDASGEVVTNFPLVQGPEPVQPPILFNPPNIGFPRPPASDSKRLAAAVPDLRAELLGPRFALFSIALRPFVHGGWQYGWKAFDNERTIAEEGTLPDIFIPVNSSDQALVGGVGSELTAKFKNGWFAGIGFAWEFPWREYRFRVKPSFDYYGEYIQVSGFSRRVAERLSNHVPTTQTAPDNPPILASYRFEEITAKREGTIHGIGPRLAVEVDVGQWQQMLVSVFVESQVYWFVDDRDIVATGGGDASGTFRLRKSARHRPGRRGCAVQLATAVSGRALLRSG